MTDSRVLGVGVDVVGVDRMARWLARYDGHVLEHLFTPEELIAVGSAAEPPVTLAVLFGAKECYGKAVGTGLVGIDPRDIETTVDGDRTRSRRTGSPTEAYGDWERIGSAVIVRLVATTNAVAPNKTEAR